MSLTEAPARSDTRCRLLLRRGAHRHCWESPGAAIEGHISSISSPRFLLRMAHNVGLYPLTPPAPVATEALGASDSVIYQRHESHTGDFAMWRPLSAQGSEQGGVMMGSTLAGQLRDRAYSVTARGSAGGQQRVVRRGGRRGERRGGNTQHSGAAATEKTRLCQNSGLRAGSTTVTRDLCGRGNIVRIDKTIRTPLRRSIPTQPSTTTDPVRSTRIREQPDKNKHRSRIRAGRTAAGPVRKAHAQQWLSPTARRHGTRRRRAVER